MATLTLADFQEVVDSGLAIYLQREVGAGMVDSFHDQLKGMREQRDKQLKDGAEPMFKPSARIAIVLMTSGGSVEFGSALIQEIKALCARYEVWMVCQTDICSMGTYLMMAVPLERRVAFADTRFYCHRSKLTANFPTRGGVDEHTYAHRERGAMMRDWRQRDQQLVRLMSKETGLSREAVTKLIENPRYFGVQHAMKIGFIGAVLK
jgi:ATP-dependent protease ClpP protease subunit